MNAPTTIEYNKAEKCTLNQGYNTRPLKPWESIIIHTTNGNKGSTFENEAEFLQNSKDVGAHFLVSKDNRIAQIVPLTHQAYHAGVVRDTMYSNAFSIGIEVHFTPQELYWTLDQLYALSWLIGTLPKLPIVTHRFAAKPPGRKIDPSGITDKFFELWIRDINAPYLQLEIIHGANIRKGPSREYAITRLLPKGNRVFALKSSGETVFNSSVWYCIGVNEYVHSSAVREVE